ncbi:carboxypeptidase-like regulatory domain-containing protein [Thermofilum pendens]|uniref:Carboxypeptidase regulatory-like domain-containing protein n=1 Tax=Thermofilum pendens (strain DSM 2475 / Hrk 5) TaxID=368408 RepID=A1RYA7_THEPD|nr:carboxypeptidase-like regulatory domain-containing protein [Thermofilum pendens]ABL78187.1 hypothetical protein Tpen_0785 [Thermofilum pendens Hrk 5]
MRREHWSTFLLCFLLLVPALRAAPIAEHYYVEVLEYVAGAWKSRYVPVNVNSPSLTVQTVASVLVVRSDPSSGLQPVSVSVDGSRYSVVNGTGVLWFAASVALDGKMHVVEVRFQKVSPGPVVSGVIGVQSSLPSSPSFNVSVPPLPGFVAAGVRLELLLLSPGDVFKVLDKPFFVLNSSSIRVLGQDIFVADVVVPFLNVSLRPGAISVKAWYLYFIPPSDDEVVYPPYSFRLFFANHPSLPGVEENALAGRPPHVLLRFARDLSEKAGLRSYNVSVTVAKPESLCGVKDYSYRVIPPEGGVLEGSRVILGANTTITVRFFSAGISLGDVVVYTPPPELLVQPPIYSLSLKFTDIAGYPLNNTYFVVYRAGVPVYSGIARGGEAVVCPLAAGTYDVVAYVASRVVGRGRVTLLGDSAAEILTNTTTVSFQFVRQGAGEVLTSYKAVLKGAVELVANSSAEGLAVFHGVPPGTYSLEVYWNNTRLARYSVEVDLKGGRSVLSIQAYRLQVLVRNLLDQPVKGAVVFLEGGGFSSTRLTDEAGRADFGLVPAGNYTLIVEGAQPQTVRLISDTFRVVQVDEIVKIGGFTVTGKVALYALVATVFLAAIVAVRRALKRREKGIEEVDFAR